MVACSAMLVFEPIPLPDRPTLRGLLFALLVTVSEPVALPPAVGLKVTFTVQEAPTATDEQLSVCANGPETETPETVAVEVPELVTVTAWDELVDPCTVAGKVRLAGLALSTGPGAVPEPLSATVFVTPPAFTVSEPVALPPAVGEKVTFTVHEPPAAIDDPQLLVCANGPETEIEETEAAEPVGLATVTVCAELVVPVAWEPKLSADGLAVTEDGGYGG